MSAKGLEASIRFEVEAFEAALFPIRWDKA